MNDIVSEQEEEKGKQFATLAIKQYVCGPNGQTLELKCNKADWSPEHPVFSPYNAFYKEVLFLF